MALSARTGMASFLKIFSVFLGVIIVTGGCENPPAQKMRNRRELQTRPVGPLQQVTKEDQSDVQREYNQRIATRMGRRTTPQFSQVSLFGDIPGLATAGVQVQPGKSLQQHTFATDGECFDPLVSPDGKWLVFASTQHTLKPDIYVKSSNSTAITQITNNPASDVQPAFSPDSRRVAFCSDRTGNWDIFAVDSDGRNLQQLTDDPAPEMHPSFSSDGAKVTYCRYNTQSRQWEVWMLDLNNPGQRKFLATGLFPSFSPVENKIVYQRACQRGSQLFSIWSITLGQDDQPSAPTEIASSPDRALIGPQWSPDGKTIVYCSVPLGQNEGVPSDAQVWIVQPNGQARMPVTDAGFASFSPTWGADGKIYFCANRGDCENIWSVVPIMENVGSRTAKVQPARPVPVVEEDVADSTAGNGYHQTTSDNGIHPNRPVQLKVDRDATAEGQ